MYQKTSSLQLCAMKMWIATLVTTLFSALVVSNAYFKKKQFYPTVVYLVNSNRSLGVLYVQAFLLTWLITDLLKKLFFGTLRAAEIEHLIEHSWYAVLETFILLAAFHHDLNISFVSVITTLFVLKSFHWLASDRVDYMERSPIITLKFHLRAVTLLLLLATLDIFFIRQSWSSLKTRGASVEIVFGLEYAIMLLSAVNTFIKYVLHTIDLQSEDPWDNKAIYLRYVDIVLGFLRLCLYVSYMAFMLWILYVPLHILRRIYITTKNFQKSVYDVISSHQAIRNLNTLYPDVTDEELESANNVCIICREEMVSRCKKLPCNHIFHTSCLRSWFQRQQTCPTCRMDVLNENVITQLQQTRRQQQQGRRGGGGQQGGEGAQGMVPPPFMFPPMMPGVFPGMVPPHPPQQPQPERQEEEQGAEQPQPNGATNSAPREQQAPDSTEPAPQQQQQQEEEGGDRRQQLPPGMMPPGMMPPMLPPMMPPMMPPMIPPMGPSMMPPPPFMPPPFAMPPFPMPPFGGMMPSEDALRSLSNEELQALEGMERANVEARIALLRNVQKLLDAAVTQLNQYSTIMAAMGPAAGPGCPGFSAPPGTTKPAEANVPATNDSDSVPPQPAGLFGSSGSASRPLLDPQNSFTFSAAELNTNDSTEKKEDSEQSLGASSNETDTSGIQFTVGGENEVKSKLSVEEPETSVGHVDVEVRQRRLQRFYSLPVTSGITTAMQEKLLETASEGQGQDQQPDSQQSHNRTATEEEEDK